MVWPGTRLPCRNGSEVDECLIAMASTFKQDAKYHLNHIDRYCKPGLNKIVKSLGIFDTRNSHKAGEAPHNPSMTPVRKAVPIGSVGSRSERLCLHWKGLVLPVLLLRLSPDSHVKTWDIEANKAAHHVQCAMMRCNDGLIHGAAAPSRQACSQALTAAVKPLPGRQGRGHSESLAKPESSASARMRKDSRPTSARPGPL